TAAPSATTSSPARIYQWSVVAAAGRSAADAKAPACRYDVVREPGCPVISAGAAPIAIVTARSPSGGTSNWSGSDIARSPGAMCTESAPAKVSGRSLATSMACAPRDRAMRADVMANGPPPKMFAKRTRSVRPPIDVWITWRSVLPANPGAGGMFRGSVSCWDAAQVPTQCRSGREAGARGPPHAGSADVRARARATTQRPPDAAGTASGRSNRRVGSGRRRGPAEARRRLEPGAAVARDEGAELRVGAVRVVPLQPRPDPRLVVPTLERRVLRAREVALHLL